MNTMNPGIKRAIPGLVTGAITLAAAWPLAHSIGVAGAVDALIASAGHGRYLVLAVFYAAIFAAVGAALRGAMMLLGLTLFGGNALIDGLGRHVASPVKALLAGLTHIIRFAVITPLRIALDAVWKPIEDRLFALVNRWEIDRRLRSEYRANYREEFASFADFRRAYFGQDSKDEPKRDAAPATDALAEAFSLFGLSSDCAARELEAKYRALMKVLHPDVGGTEFLATKLNQARDLIRKQKGWTS